jgi:hypothetical protein
MRCVSLLAALLEASDVLVCHVLKVRRLLLPGLPRIHLVLLCYIHMHCVVHALWHSVVQALYMWWVICANSGLVGVLQQLDHPIL